MSSIGILIVVNDDNCYALKDNLTNLNKFDHVYVYLNNLTKNLDFNFVEFKNVSVCKSFETISLDAAYKQLFNMCYDDFFGMLDPTTFTHRDAYDHLKYEVEKEKYLIIYTDEGYILNEGKPDQKIEFYHKGDFDPELLYCQNYINRMAIYNTKHAKTLNLFNLGLNKNSDWAVALKFSQGLNPKYVKHIQESLVAVKNKEVVNSLPHFIDDEYLLLEGLVKECIEKTNRKADLKIIDNKYFLPSFKVEKEPKVSILILTKDKLDYLKPCIDSIKELTTYKNYEIVIVDNNSEENETKDYLVELSLLPGYKIFKYPFEFDFAKIHNIVIDKLDSQYVCLLNNDTKVINPDWLTEMVGIALDPAVATVGAKLLYEDNTIQHAGVLVNVCGLANHAYNGLNKDENGYWHKLKLVQNYYANTAACLLVNKEYYLKLGGMDLHLPVTYNDVDLGVVFNKIGLRNVWSPLVELHHFESKSRPNDLEEPFIKKFADAHIYFRYKHGKNVINDPFFNKHLDNSKKDFSEKKEKIPLGYPGKKTYALDIPYGLDFYKKQWLPFIVNNELVFSVRVPHETTDFNKDKLKGIVLPYHQHTGPNVNVFAKFKLDLSYENVLYSTESVSNNGNSVTFMIGKENLFLDKTDKLNIRIKLISCNTHIHLNTFYGNEEYGMYLHNSYRNRQFRVILLMEES